MALTSNIRHSGEVAIVDLDGKITLGESAGALREKLRTLSQESKHIVLNLAGVSYIDSAGLGELVSLYTTVKNSGGLVKLLSLNKKVSDLLQITKLNTIFETYDNEQDALKSFSKAAAV